MKVLDVESLTSVAYHPQTNQQMACVNQILEQYFHFLNNHPDNWGPQPPYEEFASNISTYSSTQQSLFYTSYSFHARFHQRCPQVRLYL